jgi:hypothetical protein
MSAPGPHGKAPAVVIASLLAVMSTPVVALAASGAPQPAWRGLVLVLSPAADDDLTRNAMVRIVGEFGAALFQVVMRPVDPNVDLMTQLEKAGSDLSPIAPLAAFAIVRDPDEGAAGVAVWVSNRMTRTTTVQRVQIRADNIDRAAAQLAVETVDLVRASVSGLWPMLSSSSRKGANANGPRLASSAADSSGDGSAAAARFRLGVGVGIFASFDSLPVSWAPEATLSYGHPDHIELRLALAGLSTGSDVSQGDGSGARLQRAASSIGLVRLFRFERTIQPLLSAAAGVHYVSAQGIGTSSEREHRTSAFSALLSAGGGIAVMLGSHLALTTEVDGLLIFPSVIVQVGTAAAAHLQGLSIFAHAGLLATF